MQKWYKRVDTYKYIKKELGLKSAICYLKGVGYVK